MKEKIKQFKELWANKRNRALITLILYFIFFIFVFYIIINKDNEHLPVTKTDDFTNSNYTYTINNEIIVDGNTIYYQNQPYTKDDFPMYDFDIDLKMVDGMIKEGILQSQNYIDKSKTYLVTKETKNIYITVYKENDKTNRIYVDFSEYYGYPYIMDIEVS